MNGPPTSLSTALAALALSMTAGLVFTLAWAPTVHSRYFTWISGRALGIAGYVALTALVCVGIWMRHPWRLRVALLHQASALRAHVALGASTLGLVAGHLVFLASDPYAGVGWLGAIPGMSHYRRGAVALGATALLMLCVIAATARFAGRVGTRHWLGVHRLALPTFVLVWLHGVLAGSDTASLRFLYIASMIAVASLAITRRYARDSRSVTGPAGSGWTRPQRSIGVEEPLMNERTP